MNNIKWGLLVVILNLLSIFFVWSREKDLDSVFDESSKTFLPIPLIFNNPTLETGFGGIGIYFF